MAAARQLRRSGPAAHRSARWLSGGARRSRLAAAPVRSSGGLLALLLAGLCPAAGGCVSTIEDSGSGDILVPAVATTAVVIPIEGVGAPTAGPLVEFYEGVLARLHEAHQERNLPLMRELLARYYRDNAPRWARERLRGFQALTAGLALELHVRDHARLEPVDGSDGASVIGAPVTFVLVVPPLSGSAMTLGGHDDADPIGIGVHLVLDDRFLDGSSRRHESGDVVRLPAAFTLHTEDLRVPIELDFGGSDAVERSVLVRVDLLPGYVAATDLSAGPDAEVVRAPLRRTTMAAMTTTQWPDGYQSIRGKPLESLRAAMALGDAAHFRHVRLAAGFAEGQDRRAAVDALVDWVRLGRPDQALVAMATLAAIGVADIAIGDRDGWLAWWESQRR